MKGKVEEEDDYVENPTSTELVESGRNIVIAMG
jgi:hypothetical protein